MTRLSKRLIAPAVLFLIVITFYWKFTLSGQYELMWTPDLAQQVVPWFHVAARQWSSGTLPLWDPHMWGGQPLLGQAQPGVAYFLNWALFSIPLRNGFFSADILHWYFAIIHFMAALFCYWLCRDLRRSVPASIVAGLIFSLTGYMAVTGWPQMINGAVWAPLVFLFLLRAVECRDPLGSAALCGLCLGMAWLSGHHQVPIFLSLAAAATWMFYAFRGRRIDTDVVRSAAVAFLICALVGALQILPVREYGQHAQRWVNGPTSVGWNDKVPYSVHETFSMTPSSVLGIVLPGHATVSEPFVGFTAFTLALIGIATRWRDPRVRLFAFLGIAGVHLRSGRKHGLRRCRVLSRADDREGANARRRDMPVLSRRIRSRKLRCRHRWPPGCARVRSAMFNDARYHWHVPCRNSVCIHPDESRI